MKTAITSFLHNAARRDPSLLAYDWMVRRTAILGGLLIAFGVLASVAEWGLRALGFVATLGAPLGAALIAIGVAALAMALVVVIGLGVIAMFES